MRKAEERMKERETAVGVEKSRKTFSLKLDWQLRQEERSVACVACMEEACKEPGECWHAKSRRKNERKRNCSWS
jgi:hypothetical protein